MQYGEFVLGTPGGIPANVACIIFSVLVYVIVAKLTYKGEENKTHRMRKAGLI